MMAKMTWQQWIPLLLTMLFFGVYLQLSPLFMRHLDIGWHIATGDLIRATGSVPVTDPWAYTSAGAPWYNLSWAWDILASVLYEHGGFVWLQLLTLMMALALIVALATLCREYGAGPIATLICVTAAGIGYPLFAPPNNFLTISPQSVTYLFLIFFLIILHRWQSQTRFPWPIPLLMLFWVNLHGGFILGLALVGLYGILALWQCDVRRFGQSCLLLNACLLVTLVNPYGLHVYEGLAGTIGHVHQRWISEWQPALLMGSSPKGLLGALPILLFIYACGAKIKKPPELTLLTLFCGLVLLVGVYQVRYLAIFIILSAPVIAWCLTLKHGGEALPKPHHGIIGAVMLVIMLLSPTWLERKCHCRESLPEDIYPKAAIDFLKTHYPKARLINHWNFGSWIIFNTRGTIPVFIDGRGGTAYPQALFDDIAPFYIGQRGDWPQLIATYKSDTILWHAGDPKGLDQLSALKTWQKTYSDGQAVIYRRR